MLRVIEPAEVLEHHATLLGRESTQLVPRRVAEPRSAASRTWEERGRDVNAVGTGCGPAGALLLLVGLVARQAATGVEQFAIEALLPLDGSGVEPARLLGQRARSAGVAARLQALELFGEGALAARELAEPLHHRVATRSHHRQQPLRVAVHALL